MHTRFNVVIINKAFRKLAVFLAIMEKQALATF